MCGGRGRTGERCDKTLEYCTSDLLLAFLLNIHRQKYFATTAFFINSSKRMQTLFRLKHRASLLERKVQELLLNTSSEGSSIVMKLSPT
jgi:hypothetical protein